ncbi:MAG: type II secretion system protein GspL, partial [Woeseiaceae bacterium]|nr:type II secretion system protein GspL [Woeseiaceae bacterium]
VLTLSADVPARGAKLLAALPYALEDQVADDVDELHFAAGHRDADGTLPVAVVRHDRLEAWLERLEQAGIEATRIVPENHGLARTPNTLSMLVADGAVMFNDGESTQFVLPDISPGEALAATGVLDGKDDASRHLLVYCDAEIAPRYEKDWALMRHEMSSVDVNLLPDGVLPKLAVTVASGAGVNLLQGRYGAKAELGGLFRPWRFAAMFLGAFLVLVVAGKAIDIYRMNVEIDSLRAQFSETYLAIRPGANAEIVDPVGTVNSLRRSQVSVAAGPQVFLPSLQQLAAAVDGKSSVKIEAISYRAGIVDVRLLAPDIPTVDGIVQAVSASGRFVASLQSTDRIGEQVNVRLQIREADA